MKVGVIMGSVSDYEVAEAVAMLEAFGVDFEKRVVSAHRTPDLLCEYAKTARERGIGVIIAGAGMAAHLPGVIAAMTPIPVIGVPINASLDGMDALLAIAQMPPGIPVATTAINGAMNAGILAAQILAVGDSTLKAKIVDFKASLKKKIVDANQELAKVKYDYKTN